MDDHSIPATILIGRQLIFTIGNKFCFTGGYIETSAQLPGVHDVVGMWPAVWTMGNLGRAGYGASLEGMWPYTYDACDVGTAPHQVLNGEPYAATIDGDPSYGDALSFLPGQKLSRCTCPDDTTHPGPKHNDGTFVGRAAPEIDVFEAQVHEGVYSVPQISAALTLVLGRSLGSHFGGKSRNRPSLRTSQGMMMQYVFAAPRSYPVADFHFSTSLGSRKA
ncbi:hypothetical protein H0H87_001691 [Tephrocybe sp. NHM501043]|nr:hypothetical protein H0H87_001691 [Tephrocybe sp. NHM501043]